MNRIVVIGVTGSGKSTLGRRLSDKFGYPLIELDDIHWNPGWAATEDGKLRAAVAKAASGERWIAVGNYSRIVDILWPRADTLIWMDFGLWPCFLRIILRTWRRARTKESVCNGNYETIGRLFSKNSLILWLFQTYWKKKREFGAVFRDKPYTNIKNYVRLHNPQETEVFIAGL